MLDTRIVIYKAVAGFPWNQSFFSSLIITSAPEALFNHHCWLYFMPAQLSLESDFCTNGFPVAVLNICDQNLVACLLVCLAVPNLFHCPRVKLAGQQRLHLAHLCYIHSFEWRCGLLTTTTKPVAIVCPLGHRCWMAPETECRDPLQFPTH